MRYILATAFLWLGLVSLGFLFVFPSAAENSCKQGTQPRAALTANLIKAAIKVDRVFTGPELLSLRDYFKTEYGRDPLEPETDEIWIGVHPNAPNALIIELADGCANTVGPVPVPAWRKIVAGFERFAERS